MSQKERELNFRQKFLEELYSIQEYLSVAGSSKSNNFMNEVFDFVIDTIAQNPWAFPECYFLRTTTGAYRRAIFRRNYAIVYKITDSLVEVLAIYHTSRDTEQIKIE